MRAAALAALLMATPLLAQQAPGASQKDPGLEFAFEENVKLGEAIPVGDTARGSRLIIPITGGTFEGPRIRGEILPMGWDWQLKRADGCTEIKADYFIRTDDAVVINVINTGVLCPPGPDGPMPVRTHPVFEAPLGKYDWLSQSAFIGTLEASTASTGSGVRIRFFRAK